MHRPRRKRPDAANIRINRRDQIEVEFQMKIKGKPTEEQIRYHVKIGNYMPEIADYEIAAWEMKLTDLEQARDQARQHAHAEPARWHGYQRAWFERMQRASKAGY